ncbi:thiamine pyrophosphate-dependent dehydrogenase E1 component subunit alpha [Candidatus Latescibacterota bacterium]
MSVNNGRKINNVDIETILSIYRTIYTIRRFGETGIELYHKGHIYGYFHSYIGEEAIAAGVCETLRDDDYVVSNHRGHGHFIAKGIDLNKMMADLMGKRDGFSGGRAGSMHIVDNSSGNIGGNGIVGAGIPIAIGVGMGIKQEKSDRAVVCFLGDGASNNGVFGESLNLAAIYNLPVVFVIENNCYAATTLISETSLCENLSDRGKGYGIDSKSIFGNDPIEVLMTARTAIKKIRNGKGPSIIEVKTYRHFGHHVNDPGDYMPKDELEKWNDLDPVDITLQYLKDYKVPKKSINEINSEIERKIKEAVKYAENSPEPDLESFLKDIEIYDI